MSSKHSERTLVTRLLQYHLALSKVRGNSVLQLASLAVIQEFLKKDKNANIRQMFMDSGLIDSLLLAIDFALDDQSELAFLDVALKCLWFLSQLGIGPLQNMISGDVIRRLLYLLTINGSMYNFTSKFSAVFRELCENKHLIGKIQTKQMSSELHQQVHKHSGNKLKNLGTLPEELNVCHMFDTSDCDKDVNITEYLLENFSELAWPDKTEIQEKAAEGEEELWEDIFVSEIIDGPLFWAHIGMSTIATVRDIQVALATAKLQPTRCIAGDIVIVSKILNADAPFYVRARVTKVDQWKVTVWALDYGYEMDLPQNQVYAMPDHLGTHRYPPQIFLCRLAGIQPAARHHVIPKLAASILCNLCHKSIPASEILVEHGGLDILETFISHCPDPDMISYFLRLVTNIAFHAKMVNSIGNSKLTECVLDKVAVCLDNPPASLDSLLVLGTHCLCNILFKNDRSRDRFYQHEGIDVIMRMLLQHADLKDEVYKAGTHLLRIFVRTIESEQDAVADRKHSVERKRSLERHRRNRKGRGDPVLRNLPSEYAKLVEIDRRQEKTRGRSSSTEAQSRLYETAWTEDSEDDDELIMVARSNDQEDSTKCVTTRDAVHYYGQTSGNVYVLGSEVEFENDVTHELRPNKSISKVSSTVIAKHVCGLLNSGKGGSLYFGIGSTIHGVTLTRDDRDEFRLGVDRMMRDKIAPCALHSMFDVLYTPIKEKDEVNDTLTPIKDRFVAEITIKPVSNSTMYTVKGGECFYRFGAHTSQLSAQEMRQLIILEEEELYMEEMKQLSIEVEQLKTSAT